MKKSFAGNSSDCKLFYNGMSYRLTNVIIKHYIIADTTFYSPNQNAARVMDTPLCKTVLAKDRQRSEFSVR